VNARRTFVEVSAGLRGKQPAFTLANEELKNVVSPMQHFDLQMSLIYITTTWDQHI
jgi:hypothetical protein